MRLVVVILLVVIIHVIGGVALLALGALALTANKRRSSRHPLVGNLYFWVMLVTLPIGFVDGLMRHRGLSLFQVVTPPTLALGALGFVMAKLRPVRFLGRPWLAWHITGQGGSFIGVVTAASFQIFPRILPDSLLLTIAYWAVPTVVGSILIATATKRGTGRSAGRPASE